MRTLGYLFLAALAFALGVAVMPLVPFWLARIAWEERNG